MYNLSVQKIENFSFSYYTFKTLEEDFQMANHELDQLRKQVDEINLQLLHLLNKRGEIVQNWGAKASTRYETF